MPTSVSSAVRPWSARERVAERPALVLGGALVDHGLAGGPAPARRQGERVEPVVVDPVGADRSRRARRSPTVPSAFDELGDALDRAAGGLDAVDRGDLVDGRRRPDPRGRRTRRRWRRRGARSRRCRRWPTRRRLSKVFSIVSVSTMVPAMKATPRTTARPVSSVAQLVGPEALEGEREHVSVRGCFMRSRTESGVGAKISSTIRPSARKTTRSA